jgi:hypothetical protein
MSESYFETDGSVTVKSGDILTHEYILHAPATFPHGELSTG